MSLLSLLYATHIHLPIIYEFDWGWMWERRMDWSKVESDIETSKIRLNEKGWEVSRVQAQD